MPSSDATNTPGAVFHGRFSDGKTAGSRDVDVRIAATGVEIAVPGSATRRLWPFASLATAEPISDHAIDALLTSSDEPGATLFVTEGTFARRLAGVVPHLTARALRWRHARPWMWGAAAAAMLSSVIWAMNLSPSHAIARLLPDRARSALGKQALESMTNGRRVCSSPAGQIALDRLTKRLSAAAGGGATFKVVVVDWGLLNAFATPGEQIVMTRGLLAKAESADEVAGVLAHEMGHGIEMHPETALVRAIGLTAAAELLLGGSGGTVANAGLLLAQLSYSRVAEHEADAHAVGILKTAQISTKGLVDFFKRVTKLEGETGLGKTLGQVDILRSHPQTEERRKFVEDQPTYPSTPALTAGDWAHLKDICGKDTKPTDI